MIWIDTEIAGRSDPNAKIIAYIYERTRDGAIWFDYRKIGRSVGLKSWSAVRDRLVGLIRKGIVEYNENATGLRLTDYALAHIREEEIRSEQGV